MSITLAFLFCGLCFLAFIEDIMPEKYRKGIYWGVGIFLILLAGFREIGIDPDSFMYAEYYADCNNIMLLDVVEISFLWMAQLAHHVTNDVHILFVFYAFWGVLLKFVAFPRYTDSIFLVLIVYLSYYFNLHEMTQIRTGILSALYLLMVPLVAEGHRWKAAGLLLIATVFHTSALVLVPIFFLNNKEFDRKQMLFWAALIPLSYVAMKVGDIVLDFSSDIPYVGHKLQNYQDAELTGKRIVSTANVFSPIHLLSIAIFYYLLIFQRTIIDHNRYFPLLMKLYAIGLFSFATLSALPVMADRISLLYRTVTIMLIPNIAVTIRPRWCGIMAVIFVSAIYFVYMLSYIYKFA